MTFYFLFYKLSILIKKKRKKVRDFQVKTSSIHQNSSVFVLIHVQMQWHAVKLKQKGQGKVFELSKNV